MPQPEVYAALSAGQGERAGGMLLASIHDVGPRFDREISELAALYDRLMGTGRYAMLVVPDHWGQAPLRSNREFAAKLRGWSDAGTEMFVHGWYHRDSAFHSGVAALRARAMTAGEGEFLGLDKAEAARRMANGKALVEDIIGRPAAGFIAPAWLYGDGARAALRQSGFALAEDHFRVWQPASGQVLARGPVITWASRTRARQASSLAVAALARAFLRGQRAVRIATHPGDTTVPRLMRSIEATLGTFAARCRAGAYAELAACAPAAAVALRGAEVAA